MMGTCRIISTNARSANDAQLQYLTGLHERPAHYTLKLPEPSHDFRHAICYS